MEMDTEAQMVASILAKKKTAGATHAVIDIPVGQTAKVRIACGGASNWRRCSRPSRRRSSCVSKSSSPRSGGPSAGGSGRVWRRSTCSRCCAAKRAHPPTCARSRCSSRHASSNSSARYRRSAAIVRRSRRSIRGRRRSVFDRIVDAQGARPLPPPAPHRHVVESPADGRIREIDCWRMARVAKRAGAPANVAAGVKLLRTVGDVVTRGRATVRDSRAERGAIGIQPILR